MKIIAAVLIVLALVIALVPQFTDCLSHGRVLQLANGATAPMKCHWSAMAVLGLAVPLGGVAALLALSKRRESQRNLGIATGLLGVAVVAVPTVLIGVCASNQMTCNSTMLPALVLSGILVMFLGGGTSIFAIRQREVA